MGVLIDHTNYQQYLRQSTQSRSGTPDGNVYFDVQNNRIELIGVDELANLSLDGSPVEANPLTNFDGITMRALYNFENWQRRIDENLRKYKRGTDGDYRFAGAFNFVNGVKLDDTVLGDGSTDRDKIRGSGWQEYADSGDGQTSVDRIYHGVKTLVDVQATTLPYYTLATAIDELTLQSATWNDFARLGDVDEAIQVFGSTSFGDASAGDFDFTERTLVVRVRSWQYVAGETTSLATGITEFSGFSAGYGVGETLNPSNTYNLEDVYGSPRIAPWSGMTLERLDNPQLETGFNESDGTFRWVLNNSLSGTAEECAAYLDSVALQDANINEFAGSPQLDYNGKKGRVWYTRNASGKIVTDSVDGEGLFIDGLSTAERQNVILTDDSDATKTYPFFPSIDIAVGAAAVADTLAWYHVFYNEAGSPSELFDTSTAVTVKDSSGTEVKGNVTADAVANVISFAYDYDADGADKDMVVLVEGDGGVAQAITFFTVTRITTVSVTCTPPADNNA